jgi:uncharacterized membrane-anchored protein
MNAINKKHLAIFAVFAGLQVLTVAGFYASRLQTFTTGNEVALRTVPVDPRDIIRGEYIDLRYEIASISKNLAPPDEVITSGDAVYVTLVPGKSGAWEASQISKQKPADSMVAIKGMASVTASAFNVRYGIEKYFIPAGAGGLYERSGRLRVIVAIDKNGTAVIKRVEPMPSENIPPALQTKAPRFDFKVDLKSKPARFALIGEPIEFTATVYNAGTLAAPTATLEIFVPGTKKGQEPFTSYAVPSLAPGATITATRTEAFWYSSETDPFYVAAEVQHSAAEENVYNNRSRVYIAIQKEPIPMKAPPLPPPLP